MTEPTLFGGPREAVPDRDMLGQLVREPVTDRDMLGQLAEEDDVGDGQREPFSPYWNEDNKPSPREDPFEKPFFGGGHDEQQRGYRPDNTAMSRHVSSRPEDAIHDRAEEEFTPVGVPTILKHEREDHMVQDRYGSAQPQQDIRVPTILKHEREDHMVEDRYGSAQPQQDVRRVSEDPIKSMHGVVARDEGGREERRRRARSQSPQMRREASPAGDLSRSRQQERSQSAYRAEQRRGSPSPPRLSRDRHPIPTRQDRLQMNAPPPPPPPPPPIRTEQRHRAYSPVAEILIEEAPKPVRQSVADRAQVPPMRMEQRQRAYSPVAEILIEDTPKPAKQPIADRAHHRVRVEQRPRSPSPEVLIEDAPKPVKQPIADRAQHHMRKAQSIEKSSPMRGSSARLSIQGSPARLSKTLESTKSRPALVETTKHQARNQNLAQKARETIGKSAQISRAAEEETQAALPATVVRHSKFLETSKKLQRRTRKPVSTTPQPSNPREAEKFGIAAQPKKQKPQPKTRQVAPAQSNQSRPQPREPGGVVKRAHALIRKNSFRRSPQTTPPSNTSDVTAKARTTVVKPSVSRPRKDAPAPASISRPRKKTPAPPSPDRPMPVVEDKSVVSLRSSASSLVKTVRRGKANAGRRALVHSNRFSRFAENGRKPRIEKEDEMAHTSIGLGRRSRRKHISSSVPSNKPLPPLEVDEDAVAYGFSVRQWNRHLAIENGSWIPIVPKPKPRLIPAISRGPDESKMDPIQRAGFRLLSKAAVPIQAAARTYLAQKEAVNRMWAIVELQSYFRRWRCETFVFAHRHAASLIQGAFRGWLARDALNEQDYCACQVQRIVRGYLAAVRVYDHLYGLILIQSAWRAHHARQTAVDRLSKVIMLQSCARGFLVRNEVGLQHVCAIMIQSRYRAYSAQLHFQFDIVDIIIVQSVIRRWRAYLISDKKREAKEESCATTIQKYWRGFHGYSEFVFVMADILVAQRTVRRWLATRRVECMRRHASATAIQSSWRRFSAQMVVLYTLVHIIIAQSVARRFLVVRRIRRYKIILSATDTIQNWWRYRLFQIHLGRLSACVKLQRYIRYRLFRKHLNLHNSARKIQRWWHFQWFRMWKNELVATTKIQYWWRYHNFRQHKNKLVAVSKIQYWRRYRKFRKSKNELVAASKILYWWRYHVFRQCKNLLVAATTIQKWRRLIQFRRQMCRHRAATKVQGAWRQFWHYSHFLILRYEAIRIQAVARGHLARNTARLQLGCAIILQAIVRKFLARQVFLRMQITEIIIRASAQSMRENRAQKCIRGYWSIYRQQRREHEAASKIQSFFLMVKAEVEAEILRHKKRKEARTVRKKREKKEADEKLLERAWLNTVDDGGKTKGDGPPRSGDSRYRGRGSDQGYGAHPKHPPTDAVLRCSSNIQDNVSEITGPTFAHRQHQPQSPGPPRLASLTGKEMSEDLSLEEAWIDTEIREVKDRRRSEEIYMQRHGLQHHNSSYYQQSPHHRPRSDERSYYAEPSPRSRKHRQGQQQHRASPVPRSDDYLHHTQQHRSSSSARPDDYHQQQQQHRRASPASRSDDVPVLRSSPHRPDSRYHQRAESPRSHHGGYAHESPDRQGRERMNDRQRYDTTPNRRTEPPMSRSHSNGKHRNSPGYFHGSGEKHRQSDYHHNSAASVSSEKEHRHHQKDYYNAPSPRKSRQSSSASLGSPADGYRPPSRGPTQSREGGQLKQSPSQRPKSRGRSRPGPSYSDFDSEGAVDENRHDRQGYYRT
uniref:Uncharacterized protein n=1 Tax=Grammatophora oceanica TaxID=210454 RepID=A0A7S1UWH2_9STRA